MDFQKIISNIQEKGYCIITNVLDKDEIEFAREKYFEWYESTPDLAEQHLKLLNKLHGLNYVTLVPHNVIGKGQRYYDPFRNVVGIMINRCLQAKPIIIYGDGEQRRSFSNVHDCIVAVITMIESTRDICGQVYNIGPHENEISIKRP